MINFNKVLSPGGITFFHNGDFNIYLYFRNVATVAQLQIADAENLFSTMLSNGSGSILFLRKGSKWTDDGIAEFLRNQSTDAVKASLFWCSDKDSIEFLLEISRKGVGYRYYIQQSLVPEGGLKLITPDENPMVNHSKGSFIIGLQNVDLFDILDQDNTTCENFLINLAQVQQPGESTQAFSFDITVQNDFFNGGMSYFVKNKDKIDSAYSEIFSQAYPYRFILDPYVNSKNNSRNIEVSLLANDLQNHFHTSTKAFVLKPLASFKFIKSSNLSIEHKRKSAFLPQGEMEIVFPDNNEHTLLLNSGATGVAIRNGDKFVFDVNREAIFNDESLSPVEVDVPYISIETTQAESVLHASSQNKVYYSEKGTPFLPKVGDIRKIQFPILPTLNESNYLFEENYLEKARHAKLILPFKTKRKHELAEGASRVVITSKGIQAKFIENGVGSKSEVKLSNYTFTAGDSKSHKFVLEVDSPEIERLIDALEKDDIFVVVPPSLLKSRISSGSFNLSDWSFDFFKDPVEPLIVFKYNNESFKECFSEKGVQHWSNRHLGSIESSDIEEQELMRERWRQKCEKIVAKALKGEHKLNFSNPSWKGIKVFSIPISPTFVPKILQPFVPETGLFAEYIGFGSASVENGTTNIQDPKCFAAINYKSLDETLQDQPPGESENFAFKLLELNAVFTDSKIQSMDCRIKIGVKQLLEEKVTGLTPNDYREFKIRGSYNSSNEAYVFSIERDITLNFAASIFKEIKITGATLSYDATDEKTMIDFSGSVVLNPNLKFGEHSFGDFLPERADFLNLGFNLGKLLLPDFGRTKFSLSFPKLQGKSIFGSFPLKFNSFQFKTAHSLNLFSIIGQGGFETSIGFLFDLDLGTLGGLSFLKKFSAQIYIGWSFGAETRQLHFGFRLNGFPNSFSTSINFNLFDTIGIVIRKLTLCRYKVGTTPYFFLKLEDCEFNLFGKEFKTLNGAIFMNPANAKDLAWILLYKPDDTEEGISKYLKYLALGQRTGIEPTQQLPPNAYVEDVIEVLEKNLKDLECPEPGQQLLANPNVFNPSIEWLIGAHLSFEEFFDLKFVFMDPKLYAMRLKVIELFTFDALYYKVNEGTGAWRAKLELEPELRNWNFGVVDITLPNIELEALTNGDFKLDLGFPTIDRYTTDYTDSAVAQVYIFIGKGGMYFGKSKLNVVLCDNEPDTKTLLFGNAMRVGIGREFKKGPFTAAASITFYGIYEGVGCFRKDKYIPHNFELRGRAGIILEVVGRVNFKIVSAKVSLWIEVFTSILLAKGKAIRIKAGGNVSVTARIRIKVGFVKITKSFSFQTRIEYEFLIGKDKHKSMLRLPEPVAQISDRLAAAPTELQFTYIPQYSVQEGTEEKPVLKIYHTFGLLSKSEEKDNDVIYSPSIDLANGNVDGNPLKNMLSKFSQLEQQMGNIPDDFDFQPHFLFRFVPTEASDFQNQNDKLSRIQIPLIDGIRVNSAVIQSENIDNTYLALIDKQFDDFFVEYKSRTPQDKFTLLTTSDPLARQLQNDFFEFVYKEAIQINKDFNAFTGKQYHELEGLIAYFFESGLRIPDPKALDRSIPLLATFRNSSQVLNTAGQDQFEIIYTNTDSEKTTYLELSSTDKKAVVAEFTAGYEERRKALQALDIEDPFFTRKLDIAVNTSTNFVVGTKTYYHFPDMMRLKECTMSLLKEQTIEQDNESILSDDNLNRASSASFYCATLVEVLAKKLGETDIPVLFELKGASALNSKHLRLLADRDFIKNPSSLKIISNGTVISPEKAELLIYKRNLSNITHPSIEGDSFITLDSDRYLARYSANPKLFVKILLDATLTNAGGYYLEIKAAHTTIDALFSDPVNRSETLGFLFEEKSVASSQRKLRYQNVFRVDAPADSLTAENDVLFFESVKINGELVNEHVCVIPPNAIKIRLSVSDPQQFVSADIDAVGYVLKEEFNKLEFSLECDGTKIIDAEKALTLLPEGSKDKNNPAALIYQHVAPVQKKGTNRYENVGKECKITLNWRNSLGERLFEKPVAKSHMHLYSDLVVPINEWPDVSYGLLATVTGMEFYCSIGYREKVVYELAREITDLLGPKIPAGVALKKEGDHYVASKTFTIGEGIPERVNEVLKHYFHGSFALNEGDQHGDYNGILNKLQEIREQVEDIHRRNPQMIRLKLNGSTKGANIEQSLSISHQINGLLVKYSEHIEKATDYFDARQVSVKKFYNKVEKGGETKYEFSHLETDVKIKVDQQSFKVSIPNHYFTSLLGGSSFCKLSASLVVERLPGLILKSTKGVPETIRLASTRLAFSPAVLKALEAKLKGISFGTGFDSDDGGLASWMINKALVLTPVTNLAQEKSTNPIEYLLKPVSTSLWSGTYIFKKDDEEVKASFTKVDMDVALRDILTEIEKYVAPQYFTVYEEHVGDLLDVKARLAAFLSTHFVHKHVLSSQHTDEANNVDVINAVKEYLLEDLNNFYRMDGILVHKGKNTEGASPDTDYRLYTVGPFFPSDTSEQDFSIRAGKILKHQLTALVDYKKNNLKGKAEGGSVSLAGSQPLKLTITHLEHNIVAVGSDGPEQSDWITLINPFACNYEFSGFTKYYREFPQSPKSVIHTTLPESSTAPATDILRGEWKYYMDFEYRAKDQDKLVVTLTYNQQHLPKQKMLSSESLDFPAIAYLQRLLSKDDMSDLAKIRAINSIPLIVSMSEAMITDAEPEMEVITFTYNGTGWSKPGNWSINEQSNGNWRIASAKPFTIFGSLAKSKVTASMYINRNEELGSHFMMRTDEVLFPGSVSPKLDYVHIVHKADSSIREMNGVSLFEKAIERPNHRVVIEEMIWQRNGVKHLLSPCQIITVDSKPGSAQTFKFVKGMYYKVSIFDNTLKDDTILLLETNFLHKP